jgi:HAD superfamily hydrolase (TIGR01548 family)
MGQIDVLIFDMDGVLIDVSQSYLETIRRVPQVFFEEVCRFEPMEGELVSPEDVRGFKQVGGLNNDWDCTSALLACYIAALPETLPSPPEEGGMEAYLEALGKWGSSQGISLGDLASRVKPAHVAERVPRGGGLASVLDLLGLDREHLPIAFGSLSRSNVIMRLFQEMYLGPKLFEATYGEAPLVVEEPGLIEKEEVLIDTEVLDWLSSKLPLGIATGRPKAEALYALEHHNIGRFFTSIVDEDDVREAEEGFARKGERVSLRKPHPWSLLEAVRRIKELPKRVAYVGDTKDDIWAARAASRAIPCLAIGTAQRPEEFKAALAAFREAGADIVLGHPNGLKYLDIFDPCQG